MCGGEESIRIERADNGYTVDAYVPGGKDKLGKHKRRVAMNEAHVLRTVGKHLGSSKGRKGLRVMGGDNAAAPMATLTKKSAKKKSKAYKRA